MSKENIYKDKEGKVIHQGVDRRNMNGNGKLVYWILGAIFALLLIFIKISLADVSEYVKQSNNSASRISVLETYQVVTNEKLDRIDDKLDKLLLQNLGYIRK